MTVRGSRAQGIVFTFINGTITAVTITSGSATGTALPGPVPLTFDPADLLSYAAATADFSLPAPSPAPWW